MDPGFHKSTTMKVFMNRNNVGYGNAPESSKGSKKQVLWVTGLIKLINSEKKY